MVERLPVSRQASENEEKFEESLSRLRVRAQEEGSHPKDRGVRVELGLDHVPLAHLGEGGTEDFTGMCHYQIYLSQFAPLGQERS